MTAFLNKFLIFLIFISPLAFLSAQDDEELSEPNDVAVADENVQPDKAANEDNPSGEALDALVKEEEIKRQAIYDKALKLVNDGKVLVGQGKYEEADVVFLDAEKVLGTISGEWVALREKELKSYIASFRIKWAKAIENKAYRDYVNKDYDAAIMKITQAQQIKNLPQNLKVELSNFIDLCQKKIASDKFVEETELEYKDVDPDYKTRNYEMEVAYRKAKILLKNKQYTRARDAFERILVRDPYNFRATEQLRNLYKTLRRLGYRRRKSDLMERGAEVVWKWTEAVLPLPAKRPDAEETVEAQNVKSGLSEKLNSIIIKSINFTDVNIQTVVRYLGDESKRRDSTGTGINIALGMTDDELAKVPTVTMNLDNMPLGEVIRYLCQSCDLKYRVDDQVLTIGTDAIDPMDTRFFKVRSALITRIAPVAGGAEAGGDEKGGGFGGDDMFNTEDTFSDEGGSSAISTRRSVTTEALKSFFSERGVPFPENSTIAYDKRAGKLVVKNTLENLRRLDTLLRALDLEQPQVLIESKFIETRQNDLEEIGFEWWFSNNPPNPGRDWTIAQNDTLVRPLGNNVDGVNSPILPGTLYRLLNNVEFPVFGGDENFSLGMMMHAVDRHGNSEILSAPKVISKSGEEALIRMVREEYYPESWDEPELATINGQLSYTPPLPSFGEATDVGIRFVVTPTVSPNNYTITLNLNPQVLSLVDWSNYDIVYAYPTPSGQVTGSSTVKMPEIARRDVFTTVRVYDGDTIVLGGMLTEEAAGNDDRFPGLGNIPLLGFFGRVQVETNSKTNLLIFVTARIVNPDGLPVRISPNNGLFDFRR